MWSFFFLFFCLATLTEVLAGVTWSAAAIRLTLPWCHEQSEAKQYVYLSLSSRIMLSSSLSNIDERTH